MLNIKSSIKIVFTMLMLQINYANKLMLILILQIDYNVSHFIQTISNLFEKYL